MFFASKLLLLSDETYYLMLFVASITFIFVPLVGNVYQLHHEIKRWMDEAKENKHAHSQTAYNWVKTRIKLIYLTTFVSGSCFSTMALCNSCLFQLDIFCMGLSSKQKALFQSKRVISVVLLEVKSCKRDHDFSMA